MVHKLTMMETTKATGRNLAGSPKRSLFSAVELMIHTVIDANRFIPTKEIFQSDILVRIGIINYDPSTPFLVRRPTTRLLNGPITRHYATFPWASRPN
jgi:hypothetical protein